MSNFKNLAAALVLGASLGMLATGAQATPIYTSGSFATSATTSATTDVTATTSFVLTLFAGGYELGSSPAGDMLLASGSWSPRILVSSPTTLDFTNAASFDWGAATPTLGSFTGLVVTSLGAPVNDGLGHVTVSYSVDGNFDLGTDWTNAGTILTARETFSLTQTGGAGGAISISGTFQAPESTNVPEPVTLSIFGVGLAGVAALRRRRKRQTA